MTGLDVPLSDTVREIFIAVVIFLVLAAAIGRATRRPAIEGLALGQIILAVSFGAALYVVRAAGLPIWMFLLLATVVLAAGVAALRRWVFTVDGMGRGTDLLTAAAVVGIAGIIFVHRSITPDAQAGYSFFQSWVPLYIEGSIAADRFLRPDDMGFGYGFLTNIMLYPIDIQGTAAAIAYVTGLDAHAVYLGGSIATVIGSFAILAFGLRRSPWALLGFVAMTLVFFRMAGAFKWSMSDNLGDHMMYLSGSVAMYYLVCGQAGRVARIGSFVVVSTATFSRPSGVVYSALFGLVNGVRDLLRGIDRPRFLAWLIAIALAVLMAAREIYLVLTTSIFEARPHDLSFAARDWSRNITGTLNDWGIRPDPDIFPFGIPLFVFSAAALLIWGYFWRRRLAKRPAVLWIVLAPFLVLVGPLLIEAITGYRREPAGSKVYMLSVFFLAWYPFWLLSRINGLRWWPRPMQRLALAGVLAAAIGTPVGVLVFQDRVAAWYVWAVDTYRVNNTDLQMAAAIRDAYKDDPEALRQVIEKPIIYSYYEPGGGLRLFLGGDYFKDYEFWSDEVQEWMDAGAGLDEILERLGWPNVYMSFGLRLDGYGKGMRSDGWRRLIEAPTALPTRPYVRRQIEVGRARFFIVEPPTAP